MTSRRAAGWMLAVSLALVSGSVPAAPADCLAYRDNPHVAACANQYGPGTAAGRTRLTPVAAEPVRVIAEAELKSVPVVRATKAAAPAPEPEAPTFAVNREALRNTIIAGVIAGSLLVLAALGFWRWGTTLRKDCPYCGSKISKAAHTCARCFRAV